MVPQNNEKLLQAKERVRELGEAMRAGAAAMEALERVRAELRSAADVWPEEDVGGAFNATKEQFSRIGAASQHAKDAQWLLREFHEVLVDVSLRIHVGFYIDGFATIATSFFDGSVSDWVVKSKIQTVLSTCGTTIAAVSATLAECQRQLTEVERIP